MIRRQVSIDHSGGNVLMTHQLLYRGKIDPRHNQMGGEGMPQSMQGNPFQTSIFGRALETPPEVTVRGTVLLAEHISARSVPVGEEKFMKLIIHGYGSKLIVFRVPVLLFFLHTLYYNRSVLKVNPVPHQIQQLRFPHLRV